MSENHTEVKPKHRIGDTLKILRGGKELAVKICEFLSEGFVRVETEQKVGKECFALDIRSI